MGPGQGLDSKNIGQSVLAQLLDVTNITLGVWRNKCEKTADGAICGTTTTGCLGCSYSGAPGEVICALLLPSS